MAPAFIGWVTPLHPLMTVSAGLGQLPRRCITRTEAGGLIKAFTAQQGLQPELYHTHSPRIGGATTLAYRGLPDRLIGLAGRWRSDSYKTYIRANLADYARITQALTDVKTVRTV